MNAVRWGTCFCDYGYGFSFQDKGLDFRFSEGVNFEFF